MIVTRTGIKSRHVITDEHLEDLGAEAVLKALYRGCNRPTSTFVCSTLPVYAGSAVESPKGHSPAQ